MNEEQQRGRKNIYWLVQTKQWCPATGVSSVHEQASTSVSWEFSMSSGCFWGDSGAGVFNVETGCLVGVSFAVGVLPADKYGGYYRVSCKASVRHFHAIKLHMYHVVDPAHFDRMPFKPVFRSPFVTSRVSLTEEVFGANETALTSSGSAEATSNIQSTPLHTTKGDDEEELWTPPECFSPADPAPETSQERDDDWTPVDFSVNFPSLDPTPPWLKTTQKPEEIRKSIGEFSSNTPDHHQDARCFPQFNAADECFTHFNAAEERDNTGWLHVRRGLPPLWKEGSPASSGNPASSRSPSRFFPAWNSNFTLEKATKSDMFTMDFSLD